MSEQSNEQKESIRVILIKATPPVCFDLMILYIKLATSYTKDTPLIATFSLLFFLNTLTCHIQTETMIETHGIKGSNYHGKGKFAEMKRTLYHSVLILLVMLIIFGVPIIIFLEDVLRIMGMSSDVDTLIPAIKESYFWMILPLGVRMINENLKIYIQNEESELSIDLGVFHLILMVFMAPVVYLIFAVFKIREPGYALSIFIYEVFSSGYSLYLIFNYMGEKFSEKIDDYFEGFWELFFEFLMNAVGIAPVFLIIEMRVLLFAYFGTLEQIAVMGYYQSIDGVFATLAIGYLTSSRTEINNLLGKNLMEEMKEAYKKYEKLGYIIGLGISILIFVTHFILLKTGFFGEKDDFSKNIQNSYFFYSLYSLFFFNLPFYLSILRSIKNYWILNFVILKSLGEICLCYFIGIYLGFGVPGAVVSVVFTHFWMNWVFRVGIGFDFSLEVSTMEKSEDFFEGEENFDKQGIVLN